MSIPRARSSKRRVQLANLNGRIQFSAKSAFRVSTLYKWVADSQVGVVNITSGRIGCSPQKPSRRRGQAHRGGREEGKSSVTTSPCRNTLCGLKA